MFYKYYVFVKYVCESEDDDFIVMEFNELNEAMLFYKDIKSNSGHDCAIFKRLHHSYTSL